MNEKTQLPNLHIIPYRQGIAEYAARVRKEILDRKDTDFILAVDLPHGLERQVMTATKELPRTAVIVDQLLRGIPIIPTSAPVEAVRSFQETGVDLKFIDTSLPVTGNLDDYRYFIDQCRLAGITTVLKHSDYYGISPDDLLKSWLDTLDSGEGRDGFCHIAEVAAEISAAPFDESRISPYRKTRLQYMAMQLGELLKPGTDVVLVCSLAHVSGILHFLSSPPEPIDDSYIVPARTCAIGCSDLLGLSMEIPYFMYLYELFRDTPVDRETWIMEACCRAARGVPAESVRMVQRYAYNLALTDKEVYPDIYNLVAAAKYCVTDNYAADLFFLLNSYPPSRDTRSECSLRHIVDYNFLPLGSARSFTLEVSLFNESSAIRRIRERLKRGTRSFGYSRWTRTPASVRNELEFMKYMTAHFTACQPTDDAYETQEFISGFCDGPDVREMIRHLPSPKVYVREPARQNRTAYVLDFRSAPIRTRGSGSLPEGKRGSIQEPLTMGARFCNSAIFLDKNYPWVGLARFEGKHYICGVMVAFAGIEKDPIPMMQEMSSARPLESAVRTGLRHANRVFVFTDLPQEIEGMFPDRTAVKVLPTSTIPPPVFALVREFDIIGNRYDNRRGD